MSKRYHVIILPEAFADLTGIFEYILKDSPQNATTVVQKLLVAIDSLELLPHRYKVHPSHRSAQRVVRSMPVRPFVIYYRVIEAHDTVEVMTIRHGARRQSRRFR